MERLRNVEWWAGLRGKQERTDGRRVGLGNKVEKDLGMR